MKKILFKLSLTILISTLLSTTLAGVIRGKTYTQKFKNEYCSVNETCDLKSFKLETYEYMVQFGSSTELSFGTGAKFEYETEHIDDLENYGIVQFIRGCSFYTNELDSGEVVSYLGTTRKFFGKYTPFIHPHWVIDSVDTDPMYNNLLPGQNRHGAYRFINNNGEEKYYLHEKPELPNLFVTDLPSGAYYQSEYKSAKNTVLEFKVCIYKTEDIPLVSGPHDMLPDTAIKCFEWKTNYLFDHKSLQYTNSGVIDRDCHFKD